MRVVIKIGGELLSEAKRDEAFALADDIGALAARGDRVVVVHGGGPQTTELMKRLGLEPNIVAGRRVTDGAALEAIEMVVGGKLNVELVALLLGRGVSAVGLCGPSARVLQAIKRPPRLVKGGPDTPVDFGHVGDVVGVNVEFLDLLMLNGHTPVLACIGADASGALFNINADVVASDVAAAIHAERLVLVTGTAGILRDLDDPGSRIPRMDREDLDRAIEEGVVSGGMLPKIDESFRAIDRGIEMAHIIGRLESGSILKELDSPSSLATVLSA